MNNNAKIALSLTLTHGIGTVLGKRLWDYFKDNPEHIWESSAEELRQIEGIRESHIHYLQHIDKNAVQEELYNIIRSGVSYTTYQDENYPAILKEIYDPPLALYHRGQYLECDTKAIAIVGTRNASHYGERQAYNMAKQFAKYGITVVSGLARGIDIAAHRGALDAGGRTIAVLGSGLERIYPMNHQKDIERIVQQGMVCSEYMLNAEPLPHNFPRRNRIISGLSLGIVVIESRLKSGALITAHVGLEQGKDIFAVPGDIENVLTEGPHHLIKQGAKLVTCVEDILEEIMPLSNYIQHSKEQEENEISYQMNDDEIILWNLLNSVPKSLDYLTTLSEMLPENVNNILFQMELNGLILLIPGKGYIRNPKKIVINA